MSADCRLSVVATDCATATCRLGQSFWQPGSVVRSAAVIETMSLFVNTIEGTRMTLRPRTNDAWLVRPGVLRVPQITAAFWITKALTTAMGESTSDYLVHAIVPQVAVLLGFAVFLVSVTVQLRAGRYSPWRYWFAVSMVGVFGTMAADVLHVALGVPYLASSVLYAVVLAAVFTLWQQTEGTLSIHEVRSLRREVFYWATVVATFAMGTAVGDLAAYTFHLGYFPSAAIFAVLIAIPAIGFRWLRWNGVFCFWFAYVVTRPLGASIADGLGKPASDKGLGLGAGPVALSCAALIVGMVTYIATREQGSRQTAEMVDQGASSVADVERGAI